MLAYLIKERTSIHSVTRRDMEGFRRKQVAIQNFLS